MYTQRGLGTPTSSQRNIFDSEKLSEMVLVLLTQADSNLQSLDLESDALATEPPRHVTPCAYLGGGGGGETELVTEWL